MEDIGSTIAVNPLRAWRRNKGLRAVDIALMLGLSERAILAYETGAFKPRDSHWDGIAKVMTLKADDLKKKWAEWLASKRSNGQA